MVAPDGNDHAAGTREAPWRTMEPAGRILKPGDTLCLAAGLYDHPLLLRGCRGAAENPIRIVPLDRKNATVNFWPCQDDALVLKGCAYIVVSGLRVVGPTQGAGLKLSECDSLAVEGNTVLESRGAGIVLRHTSNSTIRGNVCFHNESGLHLRWSSGNRIEANTCAFGNKTSEHADGIGASESEKNVYLCNLLVGNNDDGLDTWTSMRNTVEFNLSTDNGDGRNGDGNGFKLGGNRRGAILESATWTGGGNTVVSNVSFGNRGTGFTNNHGKDNRFEGNVAFGNGNTGGYAAIPETDPAAAEPIRQRIRAAFSGLKAEGILLPGWESLPDEFAKVRALGLWPEP